MIFVGGVVVSLYATHPASDEIRMTTDIDITIEIKHFQEWAILNEALIAHKFNPDPMGHAMIRYRYKNIPVDVIPDGADIAVGDSNKWYHYSYNDVRTVKVNSQEIQIFSPAVFIATKFEAFKNRGKDYRTSHDIEDILYVLQNSEGIIEDAKGAHLEVQKFLKEELLKILNHSSGDEILSAHLQPILLSELLPHLKQIMQSIIES